MDKKNNLGHSLRPVYLLCIVLIVIVLFNPIKTFVKSQIEKQNFRTFYTQLSSFENLKNWSSFYDFLPNSIKRFVSKSQYIDYKTNISKQLFSSKTIINSIEINGDIGKINRTKVQCLSSECTGSNRIIDTSDKTYVYVNGKWKMLENEPSEKALINAQFAFANNSQKNINEGIKIWSEFGVSSLNYAIHNFALYLDNNPEELAKLINYNENYKADQNRVVRNPLPIPTTHPFIYVPPKQTNCQSNGMGGFNCTTY